MVKFKTAVSISVLALAISVAGCSKGTDGAVLAKVNRSSITEADFKRQLGDLAPQMQQAVATDARARKEFLDDLIGIELVIQEAKRQGLDKDAEFKKRQEAIKKEMERRVQEETKNDLFNGVLKKELGDQLGKVAVPSDKEVAEYFNKNRDKIRNAAGKQFTLKEIGPQLKARMVQEKRREVYLEYAKSLKAKAKISVDDKALDTLMAALSQPAEVQGLHVQKLPAPK